MHAIHLLYATSPHRRDAPSEPGVVQRYDKHGNRLGQQVHGCGCGICARQPNPGQALPSGKLSEAR